ncbi:Spb1 C-terminal domain-containing protein [Neohortaea acidophila]|uniref:Spb1 C-terminal domain-containing protein n=1 Tax=Neohortaea acidophila TaxID=245834 RepID=A0A6A6Q1H4_9PEZI|nr:Spb1 C-terminal domain-containing protein [Neohortaea acidophila]KAF2486250.1 Spb1 C-terminal domain-containing protein [Neohortaea acidophila]
MAIQKKHAKARLDKYYYLAKEKNYRARAAFKLIQLNKKFSFLQSSRCLIDLCAAPGSWLQVAAETMPAKSLIIGVDLSPIKPIPRTITFQDDITSDKCRATIRGHLKGWKADTVVHDGAPNDAFTQNELVLASLKLATDFLAPNGTFVTKVFRSKDSSKLEWIFKQLFARVEQTKPPSSRNVSAETFYVCRGYKAPRHMDPKFLDSKFAFAEVEAAAVNNEARVFNPEKKRRKRDGYEEGDWTQFHEEPATNFIQTQDPIEMLGRLNKLHFRQENGDDIALAALDRLPETTEEVRICCQDLKVLGRKEFKLLLRWRLKAREIFGLRVKKTSDTAKTAGSGADAAATDGLVGEEVATVESMDDEMRLQGEIQHMKDMQDKVKRKERRRDNEKKRKEIVRLQMNMTTPMEIGIESAEGGDATFKLKDVDRSEVRDQIIRGRMLTSAVREPEKKDEEDSEEEESDEEEDGLERQLDSLYEDYQARREDRDTKARAKRVRREANAMEDDEFEGFDAQDQGAETDASSDADLIEDDSADDLDDEQDGRKLMTELQPRTAPGALSGRAATFFQRDIFKDIEGMDDASEHDDEEAEKERDSGVDVASPDLQPKAGGKKEGRPNIDIITAEAMTLAHALATGKTTKAQLADDIFNKYSHRDTDGLPEWFLDDEGKHSRPHRPVSAEAAQAIKEKLRALNARPIKKVREAKARKHLRTARRLEKLKRKSEGLAEGGDMSERDAANNIAALMAKAKKTGGSKKKKEVKVVRAGGFNKGAGRPRGVKGKYKMVDPRLKKDVRGEKRLAKKMKGKK